MASKSGMYAKAALSERFDTAAIYADGWTDPRST